MSILDKIKKNIAFLPPRFVIAGPEGVGKSSVASNFPTPLFIALEGAMTGFEYVPHLEPANFNEVMTLVEDLATSSTQYKTVVIDTADWLERLIHRHICDKDGKNNIEDYGYGKGYKMAEYELSRLLSKLDKLREKGMTVIILSHVQIRTFNSPEGDSYERFEMKGHKGFTGMLREWPDACLFVTYKVHKRKSEGKERTVGGERVIHTQWSPAWDAKNRLNLPEEIPLSWEALDTAVKENSLPTLRGNYLKLLENSIVSDEIKAKEKSSVESFSSDQIRIRIERIKLKQKETVS